MKRKVKKDMGHKAPAKKREKMLSRNLQKRCRVQSKIKYATEDDARKAIKIVRKRFGPKLNPYLCKHCGNWHMGHNRKPERRKGNNGGENTKPKPSINSDINSSNIVANT